jgi:arylsulfatase
MSKPFKGTINIDIKDSTPDWAPYAQPMAPEGAPSVLYVVLDDVGFSALEPFGGAIETPNIKRIADRGLRYTNFHTTALCSPTRSCLLTGRNHTTNGMACITEGASGFPGANGHIPLECATAAEVLGEQGWNTFMVGKWHLCAEDEENLASIRQQWPVGRGFERFYGWLGAETNQWYPDLVYDNHPVDQPKTPEEGYHVSADITDKAMSFIRDAKAVAPDKPFFLYYAFGAGHAPHQVPKEWADKYKGKFDMGYEAYRELVFKKQKKLRIIPDSAELSPINPYGDLKGPKGQSRTSSARGPPCRPTRRSCSPGWRRSTPGSSATPTISSAGCSTTSRIRGSWRTRWSCSCPTTAPPARAARTAQSTRTSSRTASRTRSRRT